MTNRKTQNCDQNGSDVNKTKYFEELVDRRMGARHKLIHIKVTVTAFFFMRKDRANFTSCFVPNDWQRQLWWKKTMPATSCDNTLYAKNSKTKSNFYWTSLNLTLVIFPLKMPVISSIKPIISRNTNCNIFSATVVHFNSSPSIDRNMFLIHFFVIYCDLPMPRTILLTSCFTVILTTCTLPAIPVMLSSINIHYDQ